jgi:archaellum component FlaC
MIDDNEIQIIQNQLSRIIEAIKSLDKQLTKILTAVERLPNELRPLE